MSTRKFIILVMVTLTEAFDKLHWTLIVHENKDIIGSNEISQFRSQIFTRTSHKNVRFHLIDSNARQFENIFRFTRVRYLTRYLLNVECNTKFPLFP